MIIELEYAIDSSKGGIMDEPSSGAERHIDKIEQQVQDAFKELERLYKERIIVRNANELEAIERQIVAATDKLAGLMTAHKVQQSIDSRELHEEARNLVKSSPKKLKNQGPREVEISLARGEPVKIKTNYYSRKGKKKLKKKRVGLYPTLMLLGIHDHCSPYLASEVSIMAVVLSSFQETSNIMKERGTHIGVNTIRKIAQRFSLRAQATKVAEPYLCNESVAGYRVVVSTDGGRVRIRKNISVAQRLQKDAVVIPPNGKSQNFWRFTQLVLMGRWIVTFTHS